MHWAPTYLVARLVGDSEFRQDHYSPSEETARVHATYWEEHLFISEHGDAPKDCRSIRKCTQLALELIRSRGRPVKKLFFVTVTGGENHGAAALFQYSVSAEDYEAEAVWCPTAANHSGQPSDSTGGTFKRWLTSQASAGNLMGRNNARKLVEFCQSAPKFSEGEQAKFLAAQTVNRFYYLITKELVLDEVIKARTVLKLPGVSAYKQAFSTPIAKDLLVRKRICTCSECLECNWDFCELQV